MAPDPIVVVLDTSILRSDIGLGGVEFESLGRLCTDGIVKLRLSTVTIGEFESQRVAFATKALSTAEAELETALTQTRRAGARGLETEIRSAKATVERLRDETRQRTLDDFQAWMGRVGVVPIPFDPADTAAVFQGYFSGAPPFKKEKSREDLPDAFIWEAAKRATDEAGAIHFLAKDDALRDASDTDPRITKHGSLGEFLACQAVKAKQDEMNLHARAIRRQRSEDVITRLLALLEGSPEQLSNAVKDGLAEELVGADIDASALSWAEEPIYVSYADGVEIEEIDIHGAIVLPGAIASVPVHFSADVDVDYWADRFSALDMNLSPTGEENPHSIEVSDSVRVEGVATVSVDLLDAAALYDADDGTLLDAALIRLRGVDRAAIMDPVW
ncbi:MAG TPA: PIN domain-containing protein [Rhodothermales bacterium]|nr:PIN domain-containing protein [Rhodothermales bacterium]